MEMDYDGSTPITEIDFLTQEMVQERLKYLRGVLGWSWPKIAESVEFSPIPAGTLYNIVTEGEVPKKWWGMLNVRATLETKRIAIHKTDMDSAAKTIMANIALDNVYLLIEKLNFMYSLYPLEENYDE